MSCHVKTSSLVKHSDLILQSFNLREFSFLSLSRFNSTTSLDFYRVTSAPRQYLDIRSLSRRFMLLQLRSMLKCASMKLSHHDFEKIHIFKFYFIIHFTLFYSFAICIVLIVCCSYCFSSSHYFFALLAQHSKHCLNIY